MGTTASGKDERLAEAVVEPDGDVPGDLDVLALIVADGDLIGVVEEDVRRLQRRVGEQSGGDEVATPFGRLVLELRHPAQLAEADVALHQPRQLGVFGDVALHEHRGHVGIEADGEEDRGELDRALADDARLLGHGEGVEVDDAVEDLLLVLSRHPVAKRSEVGAEVGVAGRLHAGQDSCHRLMLRSTRTPGVVRIRQPGGVVR